MKPKPRLRLRTLLLAMSLLVLAAPLGGIYFFRLYENELVRQTESELIAQGAFVSSLYKHALMPLLARPAAYGMPASASGAEGKYTPVIPILELSATALLPQRPDAIASAPPDPLALRAAQTVTPVLHEALMTTLAGVRITDYRGVVVAGNEEVGQSLAAIEEVKTALSGRYAAALRKRISKHEPPPLASISRGTNIRIFVAMPITSEGRVLGMAYLSRAPRNILKGLFDNRDAALAAGGIALLATAALALLASYAIGRPIHALIGQTQRIGRGEKDIAPIDAPVTHEIASLSENIAEMARTIAQRSDYIRNFAMHVSHEFKTPLTAIQGAIELIGEHGASMDKAQMERFLTNTGKDVERLTLLVTRLLELARADVLQPRAEDCSLAEEMEKLRSAFGGERFAVIFKAPETLRIPLPSDIVQTVLGNLIENSRQHGAAEAVITAAATENSVTLTVSDDGPGISPANAEKLFTPFFTTRREGGGTGLGLVIIRSLLSAYHATIRYKTEGAGAAFLIRIPV